MRCFLKTLQLLALCAALALTACKSKTASDNSPSSSGGGGSTGGASAISPSDDPKQVVVKSMRALFDTKSFRARLESSTPGRTIVATMEYAEPDRYHMKTDAGDLIIIGNDAYETRSGGKWEKMPGDMGAALISSFRDPQLIEELSKDAEVKYVGTETLDGKPTLVYEYTINNSHGTPVKAVSKMWIGAGDALPRKVAGEAEYNNTKSRTLYTYSDFNTDIRIEPPIK